jgi:hypothetical protein
MEFLVPPNGTTRTYSGRIDFALRFWGSRNEGLKDVQRRCVAGHAMVPCFSAAMAVAKDDPAAPATKEGLMNTKLKFAFEKETKGAVRYQEVGEDGAPAFAPQVGTLYIRKSAMPGGKIPKTLIVTIAGE